MNDGDTPHEHYILRLQECFFRNINSFVFCFFFSSSSTSWPPVRSTSPFPLTSQSQFHTDSLFHPCFASL